MAETRPRTVGRPRAADADRRILQAALQLYGDAGWHGFNMTKVANLAGVGKSSMYTRWTNRDCLFLDAFTTLIASPGPIGGTVHEVLRNEVEYRMRLYLGPQAKAVRRVFVEMASEENATIRAAYRHTYLDPIAEIRAQLWEYKMAGALPVGTSVVRLLDAIEGSALMRAFCLVPADVECFLTEIDQYAENLVCDQLYGTAPRRNLRSVS
ncbi:MAG: helix-turn-helix domain-containing protein [Actinomycetaceae bacterium]|nr:helix-turn-helix domain-containing protein [Actinomycetaceae bacterium]